MNYRTIGLCLPNIKDIILTYLAIHTLIGAVSTTYIKEKKFDHQHKANDATNSVYGRRYGPLFRKDKDVLQYLRLFGKDAMLWRCKNAIQPYWNWKPLPVVELYCEGIGHMKAVNWYHNGKPLEIGNRYSLNMYPHFQEGHYFSTWIDFRLRIYNATHRDSGVYTFEVIGKKGSISNQNVYVDISVKHRKRKDRLWWDTNRRHKKDVSPELN